MVAPVFVKITEYKELLNILQETQKKLDQTRSVLAKINDTKTKEDELLSQWSLDIDEVEKRLHDIQNTLSAPHE